jgi:hypothetical protein
MQKHSLLWFSCIRSYGLNHRNLSWRELKWLRTQSLWLCLWIEKSVRVLLISFKYARSISKLTAFFFPLALSGIKWCALPFLCVARELLHCWHCVFTHQCQQLIFYFLICWHFLSSTIRNVALATMRLLLTDYTAAAAAVDCSLPIS